MAQNNLRLLIQCFFIAVIITFITSSTRGQHAPIPERERLPFLVTGSSAKITCSLVFIAKRKPSTSNPIFEELNGPFSQFANITIDYENQRVFSSASKFGYPQMVRIATFNKMFGCRLSDGIMKLPMMPIAKAMSSVNSNWTISINSKVQNIVNEMFASSPQCNNRAVVVIKDKKLIAEKYTAPFTSETLQIGNSMSKSILNALIGKRIMDDNIKITDKVNAMEWNLPNDARNEITVDDLLRMVSGLEWREAGDYVSSDYQNMLYVRMDMARFASNKTLTSPPKSKFYYSSGSSNILSRKLRETFDGLDEQYWHYPYDLFSDIGINRENAMLETDFVLDQVGSSFAWLSARDWAKFGQLYLDDGVAFRTGKRILPKSWVEYSRTETKVPSKENTNYGANFWLETSPYPKNTFTALGEDGQRVVIIPETGMVIVRLGLDEQWNDSPCNLKEWEMKIIQSTIKH